MDASHGVCAWLCGYCPCTHVGLGLCSRSACLCSLNAIIWLPLYAPSCPIGNEGLRDVFADAYAQSSVCVLQQDEQYRALQEAQQVRLDSQLTGCVCR